VAAVQMGAPISTAIKDALKNVRIDPTSSETQPGKGRTARVSRIDLDQARVAQKPRQPGNRGLIQIKDDPAQRRYSCRPR
jgi:hypothetical protein